MLGRQVGEPVVTEGAATLTREDGRFWITVQFLQPCPPCRRVLAQRCTVLLAAFHLLPPMGSTGSELDISAAQVHQLRRPQPGLDRNEQQDAFASSPPVGVSGARSIASISSRLRKSTGRRLWRLLGIASTRCANAACCGSHTAT